MACLAAERAHAETQDAGTSESPGAPASDDGWPDLSAFLNEKYGFLPIAMPITEPAVGYGASGGLVFISSPLGGVRDGLGRPNITFVGGFGTENGSWGVAAADMRHWLDDRIQTLAAVIYANVNLDFHGLGKDSVLENSPLRYELGPKAAAVQARYRFGDSLVWAGLRYAFAATEVSFDPSAAAEQLPAYDRSSNAAGLTAIVSYDSRNTIFTPTNGTYLEASFGLFSKYLGGDDEFQRAGLVAIQYFPLPANLYFGVRGDAAAALGDAPFYLNPFISLRGVPVMRYQGEEIAQAEAELRWQFWKRFSLVGFVGGGGTWNDLEHFDNTHGVVSGGGGFRYELARQFGLHAGVDIAFSPDTTAIYLQVGSAWMRP
ncbi:MAG TPA: BamA/TamA family outer membrane protein [Polyangiaceae bacterium]|nr:BamA/TamA family outer membrane protein [Polyangiaceae bacterium]